MLVHLSANIFCQNPSRRGTQHRQQLFGGFPDIIFVARKLATGAIVNAVHHQALKRLRVLHLHRAPEGKALGVTQILPEHIVARAVRLVLHIA